jgi:hypothetical protein
MKKVIIFILALYIAFRMAVFTFFTYLDHFPRSNKYQNINITLPQIEYIDTIYSNNDEPNSAKYKISGKVSDSCLISFIHPPDTISNRFSQIRIKDNIDTTFSTEWYANIMIIKVESKQATKGSLKIGISIN